MRTSRNSWTDWTYWSSCGVRIEPEIKRMKCVAMEGLIEEANEVIKVPRKTKCVMPHWLPQHRKSALWDCQLRDISDAGWTIRLRKAAKLLKETLEEEKATDIKWLIWPLIT